MSDERLYGADALFQIPLVTRGAVDFYPKPSTPVVAAGDLKLKTDTQIRANTTAKILGFDSGSVEPLPGHDIEDSTGTHAAVVMFVIVVSGTWAGGNAAGFIFCKTVTGIGGFTNNLVMNNLTTAQSDFATVDDGTGTALYSASQLNATAGLFASDGFSWYVALTATEMQCKQGTIQIIDQTGTKLWEDQAILFETIPFYRPVVWFDPNYTGLQTLPDQGTEDAPYSSLSVAAAAASASPSRRLKSNARTTPYNGLGVSVSGIDLTDLAVDLNQSFWRISNNCTLLRTRFWNGSISSADTNYQPGQSTEHRQVEFLGPVEFANGTGIYGAFYYCSFYGSGLLFSEATLDTYPVEIIGGTFRNLTTNDTAVNVDYGGFNVKAHINGAYGDIRLKNMTNASSLLVHYGWGKLIIDDSCTAGTIRHTSHVELFAEDGISAYSGSVTTDLVSDDGGQGTTLASILTDTNELQTDWADGGRLDLILDTAASGGTTPALVWAYATRTLTQTAQQIEDTVSGSIVTLHRGDTFSASFSGLGSVAARDEIYFTVKPKQGDPTDANATFQISESSGLDITQGDTTGTGSTGGYITVTDAAAGDITVVLSADEASYLTPGDNYVYDLQMVTTGGTVQTLSSGRFKVVEDVTRSVT